jgi:phage FluMu protein Com
MDGRSVRERGTEGEAQRCACGSLLARLVAGGVELKCRRCKRIVVLPLSGESSEFRHACERPDPPDA